MDATTCPDCGAPAEVTGRSTLESTCGPMEHVKIVCVRQHWFLMSTRSLATAHRRGLASAPTGVATRPQR